MQQDYYQTVISKPRRSGNNFQQSGTILRNDTGEPVFRVREFGNVGDEASAQKLIHEQLEKKLAELEPPADWNSKVRRVLAEFERIKHREYGLFLESQKRAKDFLVYSRKHSISDIEQDHQFEAVTSEITLSCKEHAVSSTIALVGQLLDMTEAELVDLVSASEAEYNDWMEGEELKLVDLFLLKKQIYQYIVNPTEKVKEAHESHLKRMDDKR
ncbi:DUF1659 domain-containing protein [Marinobacter zhejiangensis]|uniref:Uncharacterized protein n=1 Tax=Marinobacter zhejiangensis TaxID=488535 RepID=A0A1I4PW19_9GAMM|nr:DUF1659 domain-containing protein [Marinobacter zhejiangensis]SFM31988.1 hypothetical protein SAMN04487963_2023 [Marinobacter zhejiangensis]